MNDLDTLSDAQVAALEAWDREQKSRKRRAALVAGVALVVGFLGAAVVGHAYGPQVAQAQASNVQSR